MKKRNKKNQDGATASAQGTPPSRTVGARAQFLSVVIQKGDITTLSVIFCVVLNTNRYPYSVKRKSVLAVFAVQQLFEILKLALRFFEGERGPANPRRRVALCDPPSDWLDFFWFFSSSKEEKNECRTAFNENIHWKRKLFDQEGGQPAMCHVCQNFFSRPADGHEAHDSKELFF